VNHNSEIKRFEKIGAFWQYQNGNKFHVRRSACSVHSDLYLNTDVIVSKPSLVEEIIIIKFIPEIKKRGIKPDWIITYPPYGIPIAYHLAVMINCKFGYVHSLKDEKCYFNIKPEDSVLIVADDIYSGSSIEHTISSIKKDFSCFKVIFSIANFSGQESINGFELVSFINKNASFWYKDNCPMCKKGSIAIVARHNWEKLISQERI
jgi:orotate phosphoribosyltransferase